jgi:hypothetical protein
MGKRSNFDRREADVYPTQRAAMLPLIRHLRGIHTFAEPCAGDGALVRHLESFGLRCVYAGDMSSGQGAFALDRPGRARCKMDRGIEAYRQGQRLLVLVRFASYGRTGLSLSRPGRGNPFKAHQSVRAMRQALRAVAAFQFTVLLAGVQAERLAQEA